MTDDRAVQAAAEDPLAEVMHNAYEARSAEVGWQTQERSRVAWADVPEANKQAMYAAVAAVREVIAADIEFLSLGCRNDETQRLDALEAAARIARGQS